MSQNTAQSIKLRVIAPHKLLLDDEVEEVTIPSLEGHLGILPGHRHLIVALGEGDITYLKFQQKKKFFVRGGHAEILPESVIVFTHSGKKENDHPDEG
jgi:F-type H+-transporting ATPase subunit epsilon